MSDSYNQSDFQLEQFLSGCTLKSNPDESLRGYIDGRITGANGMPNKPTAQDVIIYREKPEYKSRKKQMRINLLGLEGGRQYVNARLSRFAGETEIDWIGGTRPDGSRSTGRLQQTHAFPYLGRIAGKINQYVFSAAPNRTEADANILKDITRDGKSVNDLMRQVSDYVFACKWCWIGIDAPARKDDGTEYTLAEKEQLKIRPYWQVYSPLDVLDWHFSEQGELVWIKTQRVQYDDSNPMTVPTPKRVISLWEKGKVTEFTLLERRDRRYSGGQRTSVEVNEIELTLKDRVPFVLCGDPSAKPTAFDDLESINRTIMDLGSVDRANFFNANYPQLVLPASLMQRSVQDGYAKNITEVARLILGFKYPITLDKDDPEPKYLMPDSAALKGGSERVSSLKRELFEVVGLALEQESRQVASAESKAWDFMDVAAVMKARAETLEDAESKAVAISEAWDGDFKGWEPVYNRDFDIGNFKDEIAALVMAGNMPMPHEVNKAVVKKLVDRLDRIGTQISSEDKELLFAAINEWEEGGVSADLALPAP